MTPKEKAEEEIFKLEQQLDIPSQWRWHNFKPKQERMYSEEEVLQLLLRLQQTESYDNLYEWFEQFKKK